jgi:hypothetical protein
VVIAGSLLFAGDTKPASSSNPNTRDFEANVRQYMKLRKDVASSLPKPKKKAEPSEVVAHERALAAAIRKARSNAAPGAIITPATQRYFQSLTRREVQAPDGAPVKDTIKQGNPPADKEGADVQVKVNGNYPKAAPKSTMPASLLARFPKLPEELEYRFVGRTLILLDIGANLIVDYATQVGPSL